MNESETNLIYKVVSADEWVAATEKGAFLGAAIDLADGYIHFSTAEQLRETVEKHFAGQPDLVLVAVDAEGLGKDLKWEPSRGGALFPHLYCPLTMDSVVMSADMPLGKNGQHLIPIDC